MDEKVKQPAERPAISADNPLGPGNYKGPGAVYATPEQQAEWKAWHYWGLVEIKHNHGPQGPATFEKLIGRALYKLHTRGAYCEGAVWVLPEIADRVRAKLERHSGLRLVWKDEGDAGPLWVRATDGKLKNYRDSDQVRTFGDGGFFAQWFTRAQAQEIARTEGMELEEV